MTLKRRRRRLVHFRSVRLYNNAGMVFPLCQAHKDLDLDKCHWHMTTDAQDVTCQKCRDIKHQYPFS